MKGMIADNMGKPMEERQEAPEKEDQGAPSTESKVSGLEEEKATKAEQDAYERVVLAGSHILHNEKTNPGVMEMLQVGEPAEALADTTLFVFQQIDESGNVPETVIFQAALEILYMAGKLADKAGLYPVDDSLYAKATQQMVIKFGEAYGVSPEDVQELMESLPEDKVKSMYNEQLGYYEEGAESGEVQPQ